MKKRHIILYTAAVICTTLCTSCNDYLDKMPDNRATVDTEEKITSLLVSAYPNSHYALIAEMSSDNTDKNGLSSYTAINKLQEQAALWEEITEKEMDSPYDLWNDCYKAIASANLALQAIEEMGTPSSLLPQKGEALMCRAYAHWVLTNIFCLNYNSQSSTTDLGIPYMTESESAVSPHYSRGTVAEDYQRMADDIEEALPLMNDEHLSVPKYHFNRKAAYAFAARFYLFYVQKDKSNYDKVIQYAGEVLGNTPADVLRDWATIGAKESNNSVRAKAYADVKDRANLLLYSTFSVWARTYGPYKTGSRYTHNVTIASSESCADTPWGNREEFYFRIPSYPAIPKVIMAKMAEYMELTDMTNGIGYLHVMYPALTTDEILLTRAEAYTMKGEYDKALADLNTWGKAFYESASDVTVEDINTFYGTPVYDSKGKLISGMEYYTSKAATPKKRLHPDFTVVAGTQENFIHAILHARRILLLHEGKRWFDIKRYGIEIYRRTVLGSQITITDELKTDDPRRAIQLPQSVINAGMEPNPRN